MKYLQRLLVLLTISVAIFSCQKEYSVENVTGSNTPTAQWAFKEGGVQFKGPIDSAALDTIMGFSFLTLFGRSDDLGSQITLQVYTLGNLAVGTYKTPSSLFAYLTGVTLTYQTNPSATDSFTINISRIDSTGVTGTFSGNAYTGAATNVKKIVDGKFNALFKKAVTTPATTDSGQVVLWSTAGCGGGTSPIAVTVGGKAGSITKFFTAAPATCDPAGAFSIKLPVGSYPWVAKCGTDSITGNVTITKGGCTKQQIDFTAPVLTGDYFPTTTNSTWSNMYEGPSGDTSYQLSNGKSLLVNGFTYSEFFYSDSKYGDDTFYFRKSNPVANYYQYFKSTPTFDNQVPFEILFLKDNVAAGTTWTAGTVTGTSSGTSIKLQFNGTLLEKVASVSVAGKTYRDIIKVRMSVLASIGGLPLVENSRIERWFAKGIGVIKELQYDAPPFTQTTDVVDIDHFKIY